MRAILPRAVLAIASLLIAVFSLVIEHRAPAADSRLCIYGGCRFDQIYAGIETAGSKPSSLRGLVAADPANPLVWCSYGELLSTRGEVGEAAAAFEHAVLLGPGISPVLMRAANFDFTHGRREHGLLMATRILSQTGAFDQILFSYLQTSGLPVSSLPGSIIPATPRAAQSWLAWLSEHGSDPDLLGAWSWMRRGRLSGPKSASDLAWTLWNRKSYRAAQSLWADWLGPARGDYLRPQFLANRHFENAPDPSPFDWSLTPPASVELSRQDGLQIRFSGTENVDFYQVRQHTAVKPGRYRFSAEVQSEGLTTDQRPYFHIFDPVNAAALNVTMEPLAHVMPRSWISVQFTVPAGSEALEVRIERRPSLRFENRIAGSVQVFEVSLVPER